MKIPEWVSLRCLFLVGLILFCITDIGTTYLAKWAHPQAFNETNWIYLLTNNFLLFNIIELSFVSFFVYLLVSKYLSNNVTIFRYLNVYVLVILTLMFLSVSVSNFQISRLPKEAVQPMSDEAKAQAYVDGVYDLEALDSITPGPVRRSAGFPLFPIFFVINILQFAVWRSFESWRNKKLSLIEF